MQTSHFDDEPRAPCAPGLVAATFALMTIWAAPVADPSCDERRHRALIGCKIVSNLSLLQSHADVGLPLRQVICKVHERWLALAQAEAMSEPASTSVRPDAAPGRWH